MKRTLFVLLLAFSPFIVHCQINTFPVFYDFETEMQCPTGCGPVCPLIGEWKNADSLGINTADINWSSDAGGTSSFGTGPNVDHTYGTATNYYLYIESSCGNTGFPMARAELISPYYDFTNLSVPRLAFWYHMFGATMGTMHVDVDTSQGQGAWILDAAPSWTDNDSTWKQFVADFPGLGSRDSIRFRIRGVTGTSFTSDMAIDDIRVGPPPPLDVGVSGTSLLTQTGMTSSHPVDVIITSYGTDSLHAGDTVKVCYQINNDPVVCEDFVLPISIGQGDILSYTFTQPGNLSPQNFNFLAWTAVPNDPVQYNDHFYANIYNFPAGFNCPFMEVTTASSFFRPCRNSYIYVDYCNRGNDTAWAATVDVTLDSTLTYQNAGNGNLLSSSGNVYTFGLGDLYPGDCGTFRFVAKVDCDTALVGNTLCVDAHIYPDSICVPPDTAWDNSSLTISGQCISDSLVCFTITNAGTGNMAAPTQWRLFTNAVLDDSGMVQLCAGCDTLICFTGGGNTLRMEVDQRPFHPGSSFPAAVVEQCGNPNDTTGLVNAQPLDDLDNFVDIFCQEVTAAVDPNDKRAFPTGIDLDHYIAETQELQYFIRFQNTGNDTAFNVVINDSLSPYLDIRTVRPGVASHPFRLEMPGNNLLQFYFDNILLPDSGRDEPNSHGFITFKVKQRPNNPRGAVIENRAGIVFDIFAPVVTNTVFHTVGLPVLLSEESQEISDGRRLLLFPNPASNELTLLIEGQNIPHDFDVEFYDMLGRTFASKKGRDGYLNLNVSQWPSGLVLYRVIDHNKVIGSGKLLIRHGDQ